MPDAQSLSAGPSRPISKIVHDRVSEFSAAWREFVPDNGSKPPDPYDFLPPDPQQRAQAVPLLLEVHIEYHLKAGGTILGHPDFHRFSELRGDPERVLALAEDQ